MPAPKAKPEPHPLPHFASDTDIAGAIGIHKATVWRWAKEGRIPAPLKLGPGTTRWDAAAVFKALGTTVEEGE